MRASIRVTTSGRGLHEVTDLVQKAVRESGVREGLCTVYLRHTSASLIIQENADPSVCKDLEFFFFKLVRDAHPLYTHVAEGPDDMPAHIRSALTRTSETFIIEDGDLLLGTWQGLFLFEHRLASHRRQLEIKILAG